MTEFTCKSIGTIKSTPQGMAIYLEKEYIPGLQELSGFSHLNVLWWCHECDLDEYRGIVEVPKPYKKAPDVLGIFATRSPVRPNPIALTASPVISIDQKKGIIYLAYTDANEGTPVLDLKPYTPSIDKVQFPSVPDWCSHWPDNIEESGNFDWANEFMF